MTEHIYLDYNASTPIAPEVAAAMTPFLEFSSGSFGNPSSAHWAGEPAKAAVEKARRQVADFLGCSTEEIVFTSGGSEASNAAIKGAWWSGERKGDHVVTTAVEHPATLRPCEFLKTQGARVTVVGVDRYGRVDARKIEEALTPDTFLVSVMHANNEVGTIQPIQEIAEGLRKRGILFHCDAAQSMGKIPVCVEDLGVDLLSVAGHKLYAPKGIGALYIRKGVVLEPLIHGGGHEGGRRAGTESALLAVGLGAACELAGPCLPRMAEVKDLRDRFWKGLKARFGDEVVLNGHPEERLPNTLNVSFVGRVGADVLAGLKGVAASTGSACHEGSVELSPVLKAMGVAEHVGMGAVRFSLGRSTTVEEIDAVLRALDAG